VRRIGGKPFDRLRIKRIEGERESRLEGKKVRRMTG